MSRNALAFALWMHSDQMLGDLGIAVYGIGISDVGEFLSIDRLHDCFTIAVCLFSSEGN